MSYRETVTVGGRQEEISGTLTRDTLEQLVCSIVGRSEETVLRVLCDAGLGPSDIDRVIPIGGPTRMPAVRRMLERTAGKPEDDVDPNFTVCSGAAIEGAVMADNQNLPVLYQGLTLLNVTPLDLGEEARQKGRRRPILMIPKNTPYPTEHTASFFVNALMQTEVGISVWQGDFERRPDFVGNVNIGKFTLRGLRPGAQNEVEVTYGIDEDGILTVGAREAGTDTARQIVVDRVWEGLEAPPPLEHAEKALVPYEKWYRGSDRSRKSRAEQGDGAKLRWMCSCLDEAKRIISEHHRDFDPTFFGTARFELFLQLDAQYAYAYIRLGGAPFYPIGIHYTLRAETQANRRTLAVTLVHELLHAVHPDWGHNRIRPEERRLANLAGYYDAYREFEIKFLSGQMSACNNSMTDEEARIRISCGGPDASDGVSQDSFQSPYQ